VDLEVTASDSGFQEVLVVRDRAAGLALVADPPSLTVSSPGLLVRPDGRGGLVAVDGAGTVVFSAPPLQMWDATVGADAVTAHRTAPVGMRLAGDVVTLLPDVAMLRDPATVFPVSVDPSFTAGQLNWTDVLDLYPNNKYWDGENLGTDQYGVIEVGGDPTYGTPARAFFQMNTSPLNGKHILGATFRVTEGWATNCTPTPVQLWLTGGITSSTTWNNQPSWTTLQNTQTVAHGNPNFGCAGSASVAFTATNAAQQAAANGWSNLTLGLKASVESNSSGWKRFFPDSSLQIDYNTISTVGAMSTTPTSPCVSGSGTPAANDPVLNSPTPTLTAYADDADTAENNLTGSFVWQSWNGSAWVASGSGTDPIGRAANTQTSFTLPSGALADAGTYRWQVRINDPLMSPYSGTDESAWSPWCEFVADFSPPAAPSVSSTVYTSGCTTCGGVGTSAVFTLSDASPDVTSYSYGFSDPPSVTLTPTSAGGSVSFSWTPAHGGPTTVYVQARDAGSNISAETRYSFTVPTPAPMLSQWLMQDAAGSPSLADTTGNGHTATLAGGTLGSASRIVGVSALALNGTSSQYAQTSGPLLDTSTSFSVSAWVMVNSLSVYDSVVSEDGVHEPGFQLQYDPTCPCWNFVLPTSDTTNPSMSVAHATGGAVTGVWTHLAAVYDEGSATMSIYVNGSLAGSATGVARGFTPTGAFTIGRTKWNDSPGGYFNGNIADVQVWQRVLFPSEIAAMVDPSVNGLVEANSMENPGGAGTIETAAPDPLNLLHDLVLQGTAQVPLSGAGYQGLGLQLDGGGYADSSIDSLYNGTPNQVLHTDQSFTVSAWVRIDGTSLPTGNLTAVSQQGNLESNFYLGYRLDSGGAPHWGFAMAGADNDTGVGWVDVFSSATLTTAVLGQWTHLTGVYNAATNSMSLYVNGALAGTGARSTPGWDAAGTFTVGAAWWSSNTFTPQLTDFWVGAIDEVRAYQGILVGPAASWQFAGCTGTPVACPDFGTGNHALTLSTAGASVGNATLPSGQPGPVLTLNGTSGAAATTTGVVDSSRSFTVGAWVNPSATPTYDADAVSLSGTTRSGFELGYRLNLGQWCFSATAADTSAGTRTAACTSTALTNGAWTHLAGVYDAVNGQLRLYVNGTLAATTSYTAGWNATGPLVVGRGLSTTGTNIAWFGGSISDVQVYSGVLGDLTTIM
jgi:hypothetical protein